MTTDTASLPEIEMISPVYANVCRMVRVATPDVPFAAGAFFLHFERLPDEPTWLLSSISFKLTGGENMKLAAPRSWEFITDPDAADVELLDSAREMYPWMPALIEHARPVF